MWKRNQYNDFYKDLRSERRCVFERIVSQDSLNSGDGGPMRLLGPLLMALVCSIFDPTSELPHHVTRPYESRLHSNPRLNFLHHQEHAKTSIRQFDVKEHAKTSKRQFDVEEYAKTSRRQFDVKEHAKTSIRQFDVKEHAKTSRRQFDVKEHAKTSRRQFDVKEHAKTSKRQFDVKEHAKSSIRQFDVKEHAKSSLRQFDVKEHAKSSRRQFGVNAREKREVSQVRDPCEPFQFKEGSESKLTNPKDNPDDKTYSSNITCITKITARESERVVVLTSVGRFKMEGQYPECKNDYLEIRDGEFGYSLPVRKFCGDEAPVNLVSSGPDVWMKFHSDDSIEFEGFQIKVEFQANSASRKIPPSCKKEITGEQYGEIGSHSEDVKECREESPNSLDIQWRIETPPNTSIFLNFTSYEMALPNDCESNLVQVFGAEPDFDHNLVEFCGSKSNPVTTKLPKEGFGPSNIMYVRMYASKLARETKFSAQFTAFRTLTGQETCDKNEFDCEDGTCIDALFKCNHIVNCRLKIDEECQGAEASALKEPHVYVMLSIFSVVLFAASVFFLYTCIRKLYRDHQYIKEQLQAKSQDHLDQYDDQLSFDSDGMDRLSVPGDSPERENETNNYTRQMNGRKSGSIVSDLLQLDSPLDGDNDWPESTPILTDEIETTYKSRPRRSDASKNQKVESPKFKIFKEEDRKEAEFKSRPRRSDAGTRKESLRIETTKEEKWKAIENKDKPKRRKSNKKEESPDTEKRNEKIKKTEYADRSKHDKTKDELSRTNTLREDHKKVEHKSRPRREANKEQSPKLKESKEELWEVEGKGRSRRDTNNKEQLLTPTASKEEVSKEIEVKGRPRRDTNKKEQFLTPKASKEEDSKEMEIKGRHRRDTNKKEQLLTPTVSKEEVFMEIEDKGRPRQDTSKKEQSLRSKTTKENVNTGNKGRLRDTSNKEESLRTKSSEDMKDGRDASVGTLNTVEFGCQTRESLFLTDPVTNSDGTNSSSNSRGLPAFACSSATIVRPSSPSPAPVTTSHITIDLQAAPREPTIRADRPMSSETTRSAPDVIIVAKRLS